MNDNQLQLIKRPAAAKVSVFFARTIVLEKLLDIDSRGPMFAELDEQPTASSQSERPKAAYDDSG